LGEDINMKKITSLSLAFSFLIMSYTGLILYIVPQGKIAYWADWHLLGLSKTQYGDLHITSMVTMLFFSSFHIYYNWKPLVNYMKDKSKKISFTKKEFLIAFGLNAFFVLSTLYMIQPVKSILDLEDSIKNYWAKEHGEPPYGHAEESKLSVICKKQGINLEEAKENLKAKNILFDGDDRIIDIAKKNNSIPSDIYKIINPHAKKVKKDDGTPSNLGRKTLQELSDMGKIDLEKALKYIKSRGVDTTADTRVKHIADELETTPMELYKLII